MRRPRTSTCYHEAGHVAVAFHLSVPIRRVSVRRTADYLGAIWLNRPAHEFGQWGALSPRQRDRIERRIIVALAGSEAERRYTGRRSRIGAQQDFESTLGFLMELVGDSEEADFYHAWLECRTRNILGLAHVDAMVSALAAELRDRLELSADTASAVCRAALKSRAVVRPTETLQ
jgi:hypothetical protein